MSQDIKQLKFPDNVRTRYGMFIGSVDTPQVIVREVIDNSIDEIHAGRANNVWIYNETESSKFIVADDGGGLPIKEAFDEVNDDGNTVRKMLGITQAELAMGTLNAGSKFYKTEIGTGQNGVGSSCFVGSTLIDVFTSDDLENPIKMRIEDLSKDFEGKYVLSMDTDGKYIHTKIKNCWHTKDTDFLCEVNLNNKEFVLCTPEHKFRLRNGKYVEARDLKYNDLLNDEGLKVSYLNFWSNTMNDIPVYDIEVDSELHNFKLSVGPVVHNCTNALSNEFDVYSKLTKHDLSLIPNSISELLTNVEINDNKYYHLKYQKGIKKIENIVDINELDLPDSLKSVNPSTITTFVPDDTIFKSTKCRIPLTTRYVKYIHPNCHFYINDVEDVSVPQTYEYNFRVRCKNQNEYDDVLNPFVEFVISFGISEKFEETEWDASVNGLSTQSGLHIKAIQEAYTKAFEEFFGSCSNRAYMGINFMTIILCNEPVFSSQTKERLADIPDFYVWDIPQLVNEFRKVIRRHRDEFYANWMRIMEYLKSIKNADRISLIKSKVLITADSGSRSQCFVPHKLKDCSCTDRKRAELYICEGKSAAGTMIQARAGMDNVAILSLRGKPLNSVYHDINDVLENEEMYDLINAIGVGVNEAYSLEEVRYGKVIICADADPDGSQINALVLGALLYHLTFLVEAGYVYIAVPPLYYQNGNYYYQGDEDKIDFSKKLTRFKGLGEMSPKQFKDTVLNSENRILKQVTTGNIEESYALLTSTGARYALMKKLGYVDSEESFTSNISFPEWSSNE